LAQPSVTERSRAGATTYAVEGAPFLVIEADGSMTAHLDHEFRVPITSVARDEVRALVDRAWRAAAPPPMAARQPKAQKRKGITVDDVRAIALSFAKAEERVKAPGVHHFHVRKTLFCK